MTLADQAEALEAAGRRIIRCDRCGYYLPGWGQCPQCHWWTRERPVSTPYPFACTCGEPMEYPGTCPTCQAFRRLPSYDPASDIEAIRDDRGEIMRPSEAYRTARASLQMEYEELNRRV
jgi:hypothetical protein